MSNAKVTVYTMQSCPYCERAKSLLKSKGIAYDEVKVPMDDDAQWVALEKRSGMKTMPQIFAGEKLIGGYQDLAELDQKGGLAEFQSG